MCYFVLVPILNKVDLVESEFVFALVDLNCLFAYSKDRRFGGHWRDFFFIGKISIFTM